jgi:hypothetical protein
VVRAAAHTDPTTFVRHDGPATGTSRDDRALAAVQGELDRTPEGFIDAVFEHGADLSPGSSELRRTDYLTRALTEVYPEAIRRTDLGRRARFFEWATEPVRLYHYRVATGPEVDAVLEHVASPRTQ